MYTYALPLFNPICMVLDILCQTICLLILTLYEGIYGLNIRIVTAYRGAIPLPNPPCFYYFGFGNGNIVNIYRNYKV